MIRMSEIVASRFFNIILQNKWIFRLSPLYSKQKRVLKVLHDFTDDVIVSRRDELVQKMAENKIEDEEEEENVGVKRKLALLDVLLQSTIDGKPLTNLDIREEVDTFMFAGHDTTTSGISFCLYNLAKHPEIQQKVFDEIRNVIGDDVNQPVTQKILNDLHYLEMVIKESLRLFPSVPIFAREVQENIKISKKILSSKYFSIQFY